MQSVCVVLCLLASGCGRAPTTQPATTGPAAEIVLKTPEDAARSVLQALRAELQAVARKDQAAADRERDRIVSQILARDEIMARYRKAAGKFAESEAKALPSLVENWAAIVSYYANGLALDQMRLSPSGHVAGGVTVEVPAQGQADRTLIRVTSVLGKDDQWRVVAIDFAPREQPTTASAPAASQPAPTSRP